MPTLPRRCADGSLIVFDVPDPFPRFWAKVDRSALDGCWPWMGEINKGYGRISLNDQPIRAHRVAYVLAHGTIDPDMTVDHLCRNRACCRAEHLEAVPNRINLLRGVGACAQNARKTHCLNGHAFTPENIRARSRYGGAVHRECRTCGREWLRQNRRTPAGRERNRRKKARRHTRLRLAL